MSPNPIVPHPEAASTGGPRVMELGSGTCLGTAGRTGVVLLGAGGSRSGVPCHEGDLESSGIHRIDLSGIARAAGPAGAREISESASVWVEAGADPADPRSPA